MISEYKPLLRKLSRYCNTQEAAEDACQHAFMQLTARATNDTLENLGGWLLMVALNYARSEGRKGTVRRAALSELTSAYVMPERTIGTLALDALGRLPPKQRLAVSLHVLEGLTLAEAARGTGVNENTFKANYAQGLLKLKQEVTR